MVATALNHGLKSHVARIPFPISLSAHRLFFRDVEGAVPYDFKAGEFSETAIKMIKLVGGSPTHVKYIIKK